MEYDITIEFFKAHLNISALGGLILLVGLFLLSKNNYKHGAIVMLVLLGYVGFIHHKANKDPDFIKRIQAQTKKADVETIFWGADKGASFRDKSENKFKEAGEFDGDDDE